MRCLVCGRARCLETCPTLSENFPWPVYWSEEPPTCPVTWFLRSVQSPWGKHLSIVYPPFCAAFKKSARLHLPQRTVVHGYRLAMIPEHLLGLFIIGYNKQDYKTRRTIWKSTGQELGYDEECEYYEPHPSDTYVETSRGLTTLRQYIRNPFGPWNTCEDPNYLLQS